MKQQIILLLNAAILVVNFVVASQTTETQTRVMRTTARIACEPPLVLAEPRDANARRVREPAGNVPLARLTKFLAHTKELDRLRPAQVAALEAALRACCAEFERAAPLLRNRSGAELRGDLEALRGRAERRAREVLRAADVPEGESLSRLARIVVASAG